MTTRFGPSFDTEWRQRFERFAQSFTTEADISGWSDSGLARRVDVFSRLLDSMGTPPNAVVLDLGCGAGTYCRLLAKRGHHVVAIDYSLPSLGRAREYDAGRACRYAAADAYALPFVASIFDLIVCIGVLQAVASPERVLAEAARVLRPGGLLVIEALNARAIVARAARARAAIRGVAPRVRHYDPRRVEQWLGTRQLYSCGRAAIMLPPRKLPGLRRLLDLVPVTKTLTAVSPLTEALAHSFLFAARKLDAAGLPIMSLQSLRV